MAAAQSNKGWCHRTVRLSETPTVNTETLFAILTITCPQRTNSRACCAVAWSLLRAAMRATIGRSEWGKGYVATTRQVD